ncbi:nucleotide exchange factor GrpE [Mycoplasma simbae]|uniref:nucleotide exchange factor GrpE n=1 Tax=Mycoplasma simbae TaxID=36744 RepID=UPI000495F921|nr:nucleotide exchange factor GrpE [Mycoplasma simbae]
MSSTKIKEGTILKTNIKIFENGKFNKEISKKNYELALGKNQIHADIDKYILEHGWAKKYKVTVVFDAQAESEYAGKTLTFEIINLSFKTQNQLANEVNQSLQKALERTSEELKILSEKFIALEEINATLKEKVRELSNKLSENTRITAPKEEIDRIKEYSLQKFFEDFTNPYSTFKMAVESGVNSTDQGVKTYVGGFKMVLGMLENVFKSHGLEIVLPQVGSNFDPSYQKALEFVIDNEKEANTIVKVNSEAYKLKDRVIKPALVVLSKKESVEK